MAVGSETQPSFAAALLSAGGLPHRGSRCKISCCTPLVLFCQMFWHELLVWLLQQLNVILHAQNCIFHSPSHFANTSRSRVANRQVHGWDCLRPFLFPPFSSSSPSPLFSPFLTAPPNNCPLSSFPVWLALQAWHSFHETRISVPFPGPLRFFCQLQVSAQQPSNFRSFTTKSDDQKIDATARRRAISAHLELIIRSSGTGGCWCRWINPRHPAGGGSSRKLIANP
jgi:hypothetical protein